MKMSGSQQVFRKNLNTKLVEAVVHHRYPGKEESSGIRGKESAKAGSRP